MAALDMLTPENVGDDTDSALGALYATQSPVDLTNIQSRKDVFNRAVQRILEQRNALQTPYAGTNMGNLALGASLGKASGMPVAEGFTGGMLARAQAQEAQSQAEQATQNQRSGLDLRADMARILGEGRPNSLQEASMLGAIGGYDKVADSLAKLELYQNKINSSGGVIQAFNPKTGKMEFVPKNQAADSGMLPPPPAGFKYAEDGSLMRLEPSTRDQMRLQKSIESAQAAAGVEKLGNEALDILGRYKTSAAAPIMGKWQQALNVVGLADEQVATDFERLDKISKELGAQALQQFGGNDTDRELMIAIQSNIDPKSLVSTNVQTAQRKLTAAKILQEKPVFEEEWLAKNGSLSSPDKTTGETFSRAWMKQQKAAWESEFGKEGSSKERSTLEQSPPPEAKQAKDGKYYIPDPQRPGKFLEWQP